MDILSIYKELSSLQMTEDNVKGLAKGYQTYCALKAKGWVQTPCRLVYRKPKTVSMVVLPFYIPELKNLIWGIEAEGTYLALEAQQVKELYPGFVVAKMYGDCSVFWGDFMQATKRPFGLPTTEEFHRWHQMNGIVAPTLEVLQKAGLPAQMLSFSSFVKTLAAKPQQVAKYREFCTESATAEASLRYVLHADNTRDVFCSVGKFGPLNKRALKKCLNNLGCEVQI